MGLPSIGSKIKMYTDDDPSGRFSGGPATVSEVREQAPDRHFISFEEIPGVEFVWEGQLEIDAS